MGERPMELFNEASVTYADRWYRGNGLKLVDVHAHAYEYSEGELNEILREGVNLVSVGEDLDSSLRNIDLAERYGAVMPCAGIHPWNVSKTSATVLRDLERVVSRSNVVCIGEVGLDTKFFPETIDRQREFFVAQLRIGKEFSLPLNLHAAGAWGEVFDHLVKFDIDKALFHWYTGPMELLSKIEESGYYISINPSIRLQEKHRKIAEAASLDVILLESDGPYNYRGMRLTSLLLKETLSYLSSIKGKEESYIAEKIYLNTIEIFPDAAR